MKRDLGASFLLAPCWEEVSPCRDRLWGLCIPARWQHSGSSPKRGGHQGTPTALPLSVRIWGVPELIQARTREPWPLLPTITTAACWRLACRQGCFGTSCLWFHKAGCVGASWPQGAGAQGCPRCTWPGQVEQPHVFAAAPAAPAGGCTRRLDGFTATQLPASGTVVPRAPTHCCSWLFLALFIIPPPYSRHLKLK